MTTDRYANIRKALAMEPTPGPWEASYDKGSTRDIITQKEKYPVCMVRGVAYVGQEQYLANGHFIAACDPDTIRALLAERDRLAVENARLREALEVVIGNARLIPDPHMDGVTDCYAVPLDDIESAQAILYTDQQETAERLNDDLMRAAVTRWHELDE